MFATLFHDILDLDVNQFNYFILWRDGKNILLK